VEEIKKLDDSGSDWTIDIFLKNNPPANRLTMRTITFSYVLAFLNELYRDDPVIEFKISDDKPLRKVRKKRIHHYLIIKEKPEIKIYGVWP